MHPRSLKKITGYRTKMIALHDEIADIKSYFDGCKDDPDETNLFRYMILFFDV